MGSDLSDRNMIKLGIGFTQQTRRKKLSTVSQYQSLGITLHLYKSPDYVLCGNGFNSQSKSESNRSKCCPALTMRSLCIYIITIKIHPSCEIEDFVETNSSKLGV